MTAGPPTQPTPVHILGTSCAQRRPKVCTPCGRACELPGHPTCPRALGCTNVVHPLWTQNSFWSSRAVATPPSAPCSGTGLTAVSAVSCRAQPDKPTRLRIRAQTKTLDIREGPYCNLVSGTTAPTT